MPCLTYGQQQNVYNSIGVATWRKHKARQSKTNLEKDDGDIQRQARDEQLGKGKGSSHKEKQMEAVRQSLMCHQAWRR